MVYFLFQLMSKKQLALATYWYCAFFYFRHIYILLLNVLHINEVGFFIFVARASKQTNKQTKQFSKYLCTKTIQKIDSVSDPNKENLPENMILLDDNWSMMAEKFSGSTKSKWLRQQKALAPVVSLNHCDKVASNDAENRLKCVELFE